MSIKTITQNNLTWVNIDNIDEESLEFLKKNYNFHHLDYEDLVSEQQMPKIDSYKDYLFVVLKFPHWVIDEQNVTSHGVDVFIGADYVITIQHTRSKDLKNFFYRCMNNRKVKADWMSSSGFLLYRIIEALFQNVSPILNNLGKQISNVEQKVYKGEQDTAVIRELSIHRRNVLHFRRILDPQRYLISNLANTRKDFLDDSLSLYFDDINDYLNKIWAVIETYKETIDGLHITVESLINQRTNKVISALTVISVSLLPLTLLSGIYGMNIRGLPHAQNPFWVWAMFVGLAGFIIFVIYIMKKKKLL
ncbi:MAG: magnesium transporter CorA family protein [bacterium]|nr:magnesium transporter CorA family protein [bacterium]